MSNPWLRLQRLLPKSPMLIGTVLSVNSDQTTDVQTIGGGRVTLAGTGFSVGTKVWFQDNRIVSAAPNYTAVTITV
jgi:hypothetical protein